VELSLPPLTVRLELRFDDGEALFEHTLREGYEGARQSGGFLYDPVVRTRNWNKTKHWKVEEFLIGAWSPPRSRRGR
jgi:hypothetical protein